jgi:hypothetical protein
METPPPFKSPENHNLPPTTNPVPQEIAPDPPFTRQDSSRQSNRSPQLPDPQFVRQPPKGARYNPVVSPTEHITPNQPEQLPVPSSEDTEPQPDPAPAEQESRLGAWWAEKHTYLINDYRDPSGNFAEGCSDIALGVSEILQEDGADPKIASIRGRAIDQAGNTAALVPLPFEGRVEWGGHTVCIAAGVVYDPMLDTPVPIEEYPMLAFGEDIQITIKQNSGPTAKS